jgi:MGT family glycosyltransferase
VLAYTSPAIGHLYPIVRILQALDQRGHEVVVRTLASQVELVRGLGFQASPLAAAVEEVELSDYQGRSLPAKGRRALATFVRRARHDAADLTAAIEMHRPEVLLVDCLTWGASAVAEASGLPWVQFVPFPLAAPSSETPPFGLGLSPARGPLGRIRDRAMRPATALANDVGNLARLNKVRAGVGARGLRHLTDVYTAAPLVLHLTAAPLEYQPSDWPTQVLQVGPCSWDPPAEPPAWLNEIERPLVLVTTSSERQRDVRLVTTALEAFAGREYEVVATLPAGVMEGLEVPSNARVERFVSHSALLPLAACAITHGGAGATQKALVAGVPVCVVPFGRDQLEVARRVQVAGVGTRLSGTLLNQQRLRARVEEAIDCAPAARNMAEQFAVAPGPAGAAAAIERLACTRK